VKLSVRAKLLLASLVFISVVDLVVGAFLEHQLRTRLEQSTRDQLQRQAQTLAAADALIDPTAGPPVVDAVADRLGEAMHARVTIIGTDGAVVGDSEVALAALHDLDNHSRRPEVVQARERGLGSSRRYSTTLSAEMEYVAVRLDSGAIARVAVSVEEVEEAVGQMRLVLLAAGLVAFAAAAALSLLLPYLLTRGLRDLVGPLSSDQAGDAAASRVGADLERALGNLATERNRLAAVLQTMDQAVIAIDEAKTITTVNRAARELLSLPGNARGRPLLDFVRSPAIQALVDRATEGHSAATEIDDGVAPRRRLRVQASRRRGGDVALVFEDVTEKRRLETLRRDFVANVSHELRTPIAVIRANAETLADGALDDPKHARIFVDALARQSERLGNLVSDLLDLSRIEAGKYELARQEVDLAEVAAQIAEALASQAEARSVTIEVRVEPNVRVLADPSALEQVLTNLVENAIRYGGDHRTVEICAQSAEGEDQLRIEVRDDGPGVDPKHRERIFERFYRADPGRSRAVGGTGLGLAIVRNLVESMGGKAGVDPRRPRGSVFWFTLPRA
jgi:two-component system phosphate regulon sensor histidine kinase PhoR